MLDIPPPSNNHSYFGTLRYLRNTVRWSCGEEIQELWYPWMPKCSSHTSLCFDMDLVLFRDACCSSYETLAIVECPLFVLERAALLQCCISITSSWRFTRVKLLLELRITTSAVSTTVCIRFVSVGVVLIHCWSPS